MTAKVGELPPIRLQLEAADIRAKKSLGQNFLFDLNITRKIARAAMPFGSDTVIEVGPGPGGLSRALLLEGAERVIGIEHDRRFEPLLKDLSDASSGKFEALFEDARRADLSKFTGGKLQVVANLPYNVGTHLLIGWLSGEVWPPAYHRLTLMFQKEVAERITAAPGDPHYGRLAVLANWRCRTVRLFDVPPNAFMPPPKVTSSIVQLEPRKEPLACSVSALQSVTGAAFGQRRKMLRQSLKGLGLGADGLARMLAAASLEGTERPESLEVSTFVALARAFNENSNVGQSIHQAN